MAAVVNGNFTRATRSTARGTRTATQTSTWRLSGDFDFLVVGRVGAVGREDGVGAVAQHADHHRHEHGRHHPGERDHAPDGVEPAVRPVAGRRRRAVLRRRPRRSAAWRSRARSSCRATRPGTSAARPATRAAPRAASAASSPPCRTSATTLAPWFATTPGTRPRNGLEAGCMDSDGRHDHDGGHRQDQHARRRIDRLHLGEPQVHRDLRVADRSRDTNKKDNNIFTARLQARF